MIAKRNWTTNEKKPLKKQIKNLGGELNSALFHFTRTHHYAHHKIFTVYIPYPDWAEFMHHSYFNQHSGREIVKDSQKHAG
jgi:hypothetical protein